VKTESNKALHEAIQLVNEGVPVNAASRIKNVPKTTLRKAFMKQNEGNGSDHVLVKKAKYVVDSAKLASSTSLANPTLPEPTSCLMIPLPLNDCSPPKDSPLVTTDKEKMIKSNF